jgi:hypothetical protein
VKKRFVKVFVWKVTLYGSDTWVINKAKKKVFRKLLNVVLAKDVKS